MKITNFDRNQVRTVNEEIKSALEAIAAKHGISFRMGNIRYNNSNFNAKFEMAVVGETGEAITKEATDFNRYRALKGINAVLGDLVVMSGARYEVVGYKARSSKYPILVKSLDDGKTYKISIAHLNNCTL